MPPPVPTYVQSNSVFSTNAPSAGLLSCPFVSNVAKDDLIVVAIGYSDHNNLYNETVTDTLGNIYTRLDAVNGTGYGISVWSAKCLSSGANTVTASVSQNGGFYRMGIHEYSGVDTFGSSAHATGGGTDIDSGPIVTIRNNELIFGWTVHNSPPASGGAGFTVRETINGEITEDMVAATAGSYNATASSASSQAWWVIGASFYLDVQGLLLDSSLSMTVRGFVDAPNLGSQLNVIHSNMTADGGIVGASIPQPQAPESAYFQMLM